MNQTPDSRKAELERKRARLESLKEDRRRREEERKRKEKEDATIINKEKRAEAEDLLKELGISPEGAGDRNVKSETPHNDIDAEKNDATKAVELTASVPARDVRLTVSKVSTTAIPAKEHITYSKETQTPAENAPSVLTYDDHGGGDRDGDSDSMPSTPPIRNLHHHTSNKMPHAEPVKPAQTLTDLEHDKLLQEAVPQREMSEEEREQVLASEDFMKFMDRASRVIERAMEEDVAITIDYAGLEGEDIEGDSGAASRVLLSRQFHEERWSRGRTVTALDWCTQYPELLLASYNNNEDIPHDPDGVVLIWNMKFKKTTPEYIFHCQSPVTSTCFAKFHPNLIIGGTYSGQIALWDNRSMKRTPVQRSPLSAIAHTHPVFCISVVGSQNAHNLISISADGKLCTWSLDMLSQPQDTLDLQPQKQTKAVACTCMSFAVGEVNNFVIGAEDGSVYTACRHGSKAGVLDIFEGHHGPLTGIDCHMAPAQVDFSNLFLTSSIDWTIKLWSQKEKKCLHSFEDNGDYVNDVKWSPIHPAVFAAVDSNGRLDLWNINNDTEVPTASVISEGGVALNKLCWSLNGLQVAAADDFGKIHIFDVGEQLAVSKADEASRLVHTLQEVRENRAAHSDFPTGVGGVGGSLGSVADHPSLSASPAASPAASLLSFSSLAGSPSPATSLLSSAANTPHLGLSPLANVNAATPPPRT